MRKNIGIIVGGFKPLTRGHWNLISQASAECDEVRLIVSTKDRARPGEFPITWSQMHMVWSSFIESKLPSNVKVTYSPSPMTVALNLLIEANKNVNNHDTFVIYSDPVDMKANYSARVREKYINRLLADDQIVFKDVSRTTSRTDKPMSGTLMRQHLQSGNKPAFISGLPAPLQVYGSEIFQILREPENV